MLSDKDAIATVAVAGEMKTAWFKDPDGNIFSLVTPSSTTVRQPASASAHSTT